MNERGGEPMFARPPDNETSERDERLAQECTLALRQLTAEYDAYATSHPAYRYVAGIMRRSLPKDADAHLILTKRWEEENAAALPDGTILVSDRLLTGIEYEEELQFLLRHEWTHVREQHHQKRDTKPETVDELVASLSRDRLHEYEADLHGFAMEGRQEVNPYGGMVFFDRLAGEERHTGGGGAVHGSSMDRLLNLHYAARVFDTAALSRDLTPIPPRVIKELAPESNPLKDVLVNVFTGNPGAWAGLADQQLRRLAGLDPILLERVAKPIYAAHLGEKPNRSAPLQTQMAWDHANRMAASVVSRCREAAHEAARQVPAAERPLVRGLLAGWQYGLPLADALDEASPMHAFMDFFDGLEEPEDFLGLPELIKGVASLDVVLPSPPDEVVSLIARLACDEGVFDREDATFDNAAFQSFGKQLVAATAAAYEKRGTARVDARRLYAELLPYAVLSVPPAEIAPLIEATALQEDVDRNMYVAALSKQTHVPAETLAELAERLAVAAVGAEKNERERAKRTALIHLANGLRSELDQTDKRLATEQRLPGDASESEVAAIIAERDEAAARLNTILAEGVDAIGFASPEEMTVAFAKLLRTDLPETTADKLFRRVNLRVLVSPDRPYITPELPESDQALLFLRFARVAAPSDEEFFGAIHDYFEQESDNIFRLYASWRPEQLPLFHTLLYEPLPPAGDLQAHETNKKVSPVDTEKLDDLYELHFYESLCAHGDRASRDEMFSLLRHLEGIKPRTGTSGAHAEFPLILLERFSYDAGDADQLDQLVTVAGHIPDTELASRLQTFALERMFGSRTTAEMQRLLFEDPRTKGKFLARVQERFVDEYLRRPGELSDALQRLANTVVSEEPVVMEQMEKAIVGDFILDRLFRQPEHALMLMTGTGENDTELKQAVFDALLEFHLEMYGAQSFDDFLPVQMMLERLYNTDNLARHLILRKMLAGENGVLLDIRRRRQWMETLFDRQVATGEEPADQRLRETLRDVVGQLATSADAPTLFFLLEPFLRARMLRRPAAETPWSSIISSSNTWQLVGETEADRKTWQKEIASVIQSGNLKGRDEVSAETFTIRVRSDLSEQVDRISGAATEPPTQSGRLTPIEFIRTIAENLGAPGVRMLQVAGQYLRLTPEMEQAFRGVYDAVPGQSKLSAFHTVRREWPKLDAEVTEIGETIGGGSLATVFRLAADEGEQVLKVTNPNAAFYAEEVCRILSETFGSLSSTHPEVSRLATLAVGDIDEWIKADTADAAFLEKDTAFRATHDGFAVPGSPYRIRVPVSSGPASLYFKRESYVDGTNLTQPEALEAAGHDLKQLAKVLAADMLFQIQSGRVHADFHPGNIRVTEAKEAFLLDRNFYLDLDANDQRLVGEIMAGVNLAGAFERYLAGVPENAGKRIAGSLADVARGLAGTVSPTEVVPAILAEAKIRGWKVPLKVTLVVKNLLALNTFARRAGFESLLETLA